MVLVSGASIKMLPLAQVVFKEKAGDPQAFGMGKELFEKIVPARNDQSIVGTEDETDLDAVRTAILYLMSNGGSLLWVGREYEEEEGDSRYTKEFEVIPTSAIESLTLEFAQD